MTFDTITVGTSWTNLHDSAYLISQGVEHGDQLAAYIIGGECRFSFGDAEPTSEQGFFRESLISRQGVDLWVRAIGSPATLLVEYAP